MNSDAISVVKFRDVLLVTMPADPDDSTIAALQQRVLTAMERHEALAVVMDISAVEILDSYFARTISDTGQMISVMGGRTIIVGMRPAVAVAATHIGITLKGMEAAMTVERALDLVGGGLKRR